MEDITLDSVIETPVEDLSDDQKSFIQDHSEELDDTQKETYKDIITPKEEEEEIDVDKVEVPTRNKITDKKEDDSVDDEDDDMLPADKEAINKAVDKKMQGVDAKLAQVQTIQDQIEVDAFIRSKPEYAKYRAVALKYMAHSDYKNIPAHNIFAIVSANDAQKIGAQKEREAQKTVKATQNGGNQVRVPNGGKVDWSKATKEEMQAQKNKIFGRA